MERRLPTLSDSPSCPLAAGTKSPLTPYAQEPIPFCSISLIDPTTSLPARVGWAFSPSLGKVRVTRGKNASGAIVPKPPVEKREYPAYDDRSDTAKDVVRII